MIYNKLKTTLKEVQKRKPKEIEITSIYADFLSTGVDIIVNFKDEYSKKKKFSDFYNRAVQPVMDKAIKLERKERCTEIGDIFKKYLKLDYIEYYISADTTYTVVYKILDKDAYSEEIKIHKLLKDI